MNLKGLRVLNTRPLPQGLDLNASLLKAQARPIHLPALTIEPLTEDWQAHLPALDSIDQSIFISANAVNFFFKKIKTQHWPKTMKTIAVGKATATVLSNHKIDVDNLPDIGDSEHVLQLDSLKHVQGQTILLVKGEDGLSTIATTLVARGAHVISLSCYRRVLPKVDKKLIQKLWQETPVDIILFTSQQAMENTRRLFGKEAKEWLANTPCLVISPRLAEAAYLIGMKNIIVGSYDTILETLKSYSEECANGKVSFWRPNQGSGHDHQ